MNNYIIISSKHQSLDKMYESTNRIVTELLKNHYAVGTVMVIDDTFTAIKITFARVPVGELEEIDE